MDLTRELLTMAKAGGTNLAGVAPVERFDGAPKGHHPADLLPGAKAVITFGIRVLNRVMEWPDLLKGSPMIAEDVRVEVLRTVFYRRSGYDIINDRLNQVALDLANYLEDLGYASLFFPATYGSLPEKVGQLPAMLSQRHAAVRAGLGEFGLNNVVVTPRYGPRIRFNSVITTAPLTPSPLLESKVCQGADCHICVDECPADALSQLSGEAPEEVRLNPASRTDWTLCRKSQGSSDCMGRCLRVCPVGRST
jgi:epoxyqueuosine reductase QueG